jgi:hypothetical protein
VRMIQGCTRTLCTLRHNIQTLERWSRYGGVPELYVLVEILRPPVRIHPAYAIAPPTKNKLNELLATPV